MTFQSDHPSDGPSGTGRRVHPGDLDLPLRPDGAVDLPLGFPNARVASLVLYDLIDKYKPKKFEKVKILTLFTCPPSDFMTSKPVRTLKDMKGMELRVSGTGADVVTATEGRR